MKHLIFTLLFLSASILTPLKATADSAAQNGAIKIKTANGDAFIEVLLRHQNPRILCYVTISQKMPVPGIMYSDIQLELFDQYGNKIRCSQLDPNEKILGGTEEAGGETANALYVMALAGDQKPTSAQVAWARQKCEFTKLKWWDN